MVRKNQIGEHYKPRKLTHPCKREHDFEVLSNFQKKLQFGFVLDPHLLAFWVLLSQKTEFLGCLKCLDFGIDL